MTIKRSSLHTCACFQAKRWEEFPNLTFTFDCSDRAVGFYADTEHHCQIFHMCDEDGRRIPYICANDTSFNQEFRVCDWEYNFDCSQAPQWSVNHCHSTDEPSFWIRTGFHPAPIITILFSHLLPRLLNRHLEKVVSLAVTMV
jgi:hypothetical protein